MALYPVAPPRLVPDAAMIDTIAYYGRTHAFANEYAAIPSLHVGWMAAAGFFLARSMRGRRGAVLGVMPGTVMAVTVIVTGNHFWVDGLVGAAYTLGAALIFLSPSSVTIRLSRSAGALRAGAHTVLAQSRSTLIGNTRARASFFSMSALLAYLVAAQIVDPGFTDFWGYLVGQVAFLMVALLAGEVVFAEQGGLSWPTHVIAVACTFADVLGTDGNLYANIDEYDKLTHFAGVAALTAGLYDCLRGLAAQRRIPWNANDRLVLSVSVGIALGVGWEVYELIGDRVFGTTRVGGTWDTANDFIADALGAISIGFALWFSETGRAAEEEQRVSGSD
jgi:hypothetical protein